MTNEQIIEEIARRIYGEEAVLQMIEEGQDIPLHTVQGWHQRSNGRLRVKKGEHGIECRLWKKKKRKAGKESDGKDDENTAENPDDHDFYLCKSYLFRADQVECVKEESV